MNSFNARPFRWLFINLLGICGYVSSGLAGLQISYLVSGVSMIWPPAGVALALVWRFGFSAAPSVFLGAFALAYRQDAPFSVAVGVAFGNVAGIVLAVWLLKQKQIRFQLDTPRDLVWFLVFSCGVGVSLTALNGCLQLWSYGAVSSAQLWHVILTWWMGDVFGILMVGIPLFCFTREAWQALAKFEFVLLQLCTTLLSFLLFIYSL